jgi:hypothetical protein
VATHVWQLAASVEEVVDLSELSKLAPAQMRVTVVKKMLVELRSFDEAVKEFQRLVKSEDASLTEAQRDRLKREIGTYRRRLQPSYALLNDIRNTLASHRRALPDERDRRTFKSDFDSWGAWEQHLDKLEQQCVLERWIDAVNAAIALRNAVVEEALGTWFSVKAGELQLFFPISL